MIFDHSFKKNIPDFRFQIPDGNMWGQILFQPIGKTHQENNFTVLGLKVPK